MLHEGFLGYISLKNSRLYPRSKNIDNPVKICHNIFTIGEEISVKIRRNLHYRNLGLDPLSRNAHHKSISGKGNAFMRNRIIIFLLAILLICQGAVPAMAEESNTKVFVTISDDQGALVLAHKEVTVTDQDGDGTLTIHDALYCAHEQNYTGGAQAGFGTEDTQWGVSLTKLWGVENGGSYGYYLNNASAMSLTDAVKHGDSVQAYAYADTTTFSDMFCYFDRDTCAGGAVTLTLNGISFDPATFAPVVAPVAGAKILVDGQDSGVVTDAEGKCTVTITKNCIISATSETATLVPPVCVAEVEVPTITPTPDAEPAPKKDNSAILYYVAIAAGVVVIGIVVVILKKKK